MRVSRRGQITIPKALRERLGMHHNIEVEITLTEQGLLIKKGHNEKSNSPRQAGTGSAGHNAADASETPNDDGGGEAKHDRRFPWEYTDEERSAIYHRMMEKREERLKAGLTGVDLVAGILDEFTFDVDEYIEEIRGR